MTVIVTVEVTASSSNTCLYPWNLKPIWALVFCGNLPELWNNYWKIEHFCLDKMVTFMSCENPRIQTENSANIFVNGVQNENGGLKTTAKLLLNKIYSKWSLYDSLIFWLSNICKQYNAHCTYLWPWVYYYLYKYILLVYIILINQETNYLSIQHIYLSIYLSMTL